MCIFDINYHCIIIILSIIIIKDVYSPYNSVVAANKKARSVIGTCCRNNSGSTICSQYTPRSCHTEDNGQNKTPHLWISTSKHPSYQRQDGKRISEGVSDTKTYAHHFYKSIGGGGLAILNLKILGTL
jgi:hypothetical protein